MPTVGVVDAFGVVVYEGGGDTDEQNQYIDNDNLGDGLTVEFGQSVYDAAIPTIGLPIAHMRDTDTYQGIDPTLFTQWSELDYTIGGETGEVNRNDFIINGIEPWEDFDLRGHAPHIPQRTIPGNYGDAGNPTDDYSTQFAQAIAAAGDDQVTQEQMWADISTAF